jgi:hypothetical protein
VSATVFTATALRARLEALVGILDACADVLDEAPFRTPEPVWTRRRGDLARALEALDDTAVERLEADPAGLRAFLARYLPAFTDAEPLLEVPRLPADAAVLALPEARAPGVPGRKWTQVRAFAAALPPGDGPWLDWCSGKGHLGRLVAGLRGGALRCVEHDAALCRAGAALADDGARFECADVIDDRVRPAADETVLALHACGALHETLVERLRAGDGRRLALAPCCYHRTPDDWTPLSRSGPRVGLSREHARLAVTETVTAPARVRRRHGRERVLRLAWDALWRAQHGEATPTPQPSLPESAFGAEDADAFRALVARLDPGVATPAGATPWLAAGRARAARVRRLELARAGLRRVLELRMVLDRALALAEAGRTVRLGTFCDRAVTPRNLLLLAE